MTALRVGGRVVHRVTGREGVLNRSNEMLSYVAWADDPHPMAASGCPVATADLIPVEPVSGEGERGVAG